MRFLVMMVASLLAFAPRAGAQVVREARDDASLHAALRNVTPGTTIRIAAGRYRPGVYVANLQGTLKAPIVIEGADEKAPPLFEGGSEAWHLSDCSHVILRNIAVRGQTGNGINVDDGGTFDTPSHHILLDRLRVSDIGPKGNFDGIKLSGLRDFEVRNCVIEGWGGQAVDMVGCHRGLIEDCRFLGKEGFSQDQGPQAKGGSSGITVRRCFFRNGGNRAVQLGGSTGLAVFRPQGARYEARDLRVEGCVFVGSEAAVAFVGVDGAVFAYNTIYHPRKWVMRILQETNLPGFVSCRNGRFERNLIVFRARDVKVFANVGPNTQPETFAFANNFWYCDDEPRGSEPQLPKGETGGIHGIDPKFAAPEKDDFQPRGPKAAGYGANAWKPPAIH